MPLDSGTKVRIQTQAARALSEARKTRYPVVLVIVEGDQTDPVLWRELAEAEGLEVIDLLDRVEKESAFRRTADVWPTLVDWIREQAVRAGGLLVLEADVFATRWDENGRERFFRKVLKSETRQPMTREAAPIVMISRLAGQFKLPHNSRECGIVLDLND